jgi:hypothetical protein
VADFRRPAQPGGPDQPGLGGQLPLRHVAVVKGQLTGLKMPPDQDVVTRADGTQPRPRIPAITFGTLPRTAHFPSALVLEQPGGCLRARHRGLPGQREREIRRNPQRVSLAAAFGEGPQLGAVAIDLVPADETEPQAVSERVRADIHGQLPLRAELQVQRQPHDQGRHRVLASAPPGRGGSMLGISRARSARSGCPRCSSRSIPRRHRPGR